MNTLAPVSHSNKVCFKFKKMNLGVVLLSICLLGFTTSTTTEQTDSDLVFEEGDIAVNFVQKPTTYSSQINSKPIDLVPVSKEIDVNPQHHQDPSEDHFFGRLDHHYNRIKRSILDLFFTDPEAKPEESKDLTSTSVASTATTAAEKISTLQKRDVATPSKSTRATRDVTDPLQSSPDSDDEESKEDDNMIDTEDPGGEGDEEDTSTDGQFSGSPGVTVGPWENEIRRYFRLFITLLEPYNDEVANVAGTKFNEFSRNITLAIDDLLKAPDFVTSHLVNIIRTADPSTSKAIVDLEMSGKESKQQIEESFIAHLNAQRSLKSLSASSDGFHIRDFGENVPFTCPSSDIPCMDSDTCYPAFGRCNGNNECPDNSDEIDCPQRVIIGVDDRCRADDKFPCADNRTIICASEKCDDKPDCPGGDDEIDCEIPTACWSGEFRCKNGVCIEAARRCDGVFDCDDSTDEDNCSIAPGPTPAPVTLPPPTPPAPLLPPVCTFEEFSCDGRCFPVSKKCDNIVDCSDQSDERDCRPTSQSSNQTIECKEGFLCRKTKLCISMSKRCDKQHYDCDIIKDERRDDSDETDCPCNSTTQFTCKNGVCISISNRCDGIYQCYDKSDEENCVSTTVGPVTLPTPITTTDSNELPSANNRTIVSPKSENCSLDQIRCYDGACIAGSKRCDGNRDCSQGEDESGCPMPEAPRCSPSDFVCDDGACVSGSSRCNGNTECADASDEKNCPRPSCRSDEFQCDDRHCILTYRRCDGYPDCRDGSDELNCPRCRADEFTCGDGHCVPMIRHCDGNPDCRDFSDEIGCPPPTTTTTTTTSTPPPPPRCNAGEYECWDHHCIPEFRKCDGTPDCRDYSDEVGCPPRPTPGPSPPEDPRICRVDQYTCVFTRQCVALTARCNSRIDCLDGSDEINCTSSINQLSLRAYPTDQIIKASQEVVFMCRDEGPLRAPITWERGNGLPLPVNYRIVETGRLEIPNIQLSHAGTYICKAVGQYSHLAGAQIPVYLTVEPFVPITARPPLACGFNEATCLNGECIPKEFVCNQRYDCADKSDEMRCNPLGCEPNEFRCANGRCIQKNWRCDSENDCKDGSDEQNCTPNPPGSPCRYNEFQCANGTQCIPKSFQCDTQLDCLDGSDEIGCSKVFIITPPPPLITLNVGETFTITCSTAGVPTPEVVWRLNWGHVPAKCTTSSVNGVGTLICTNIQPTDQGAYSCEGINSKGSTFATPDTILVVRDNRPSGCPAGQFNDLALSANECISCFCFGATTECKSANLYIFQALPPIYQFSVAKVRYRPTSSEIEFDSNDLVSLRTSILGADSFQVKDVLDNFEPPDHPYLSLPSTYYGNQLKSYGGYIKYNVRYDDTGYPLDTPLIIISGNNEKIFYNGTQYFANNGTQVISSQSYEVNARIFYGAWFKEGSGSPGGDVPSLTPPVLATRQEIMMILASVDKILLKLRYTDSPAIDTVISNFKLDSAGASNTGQGQAAFVEECRCPAGYTGLSCETCAPGYVRRVEGLWLGQCYKPESCAPGTYGDPLRGIPCQPCPCPSSNPANQFGRTCYLDSDNEPTCQCPPGYTGRRCERCSAGYVGNPLIPGDYCKQSACDPAGSTSLVPNPRTGQCTCKDSVTGYYCNQCKANTFNLASSNIFGCISCFCMGLSRNCVSSHWYRQAITATFVRSTEDFKIIRRQDVDRAIPGLEVQLGDREIVYSSFPSNDQGVYYWVLPPNFLADKVTSYGGVLNYTLRYVPTPGGQSSRNNAPDIEIISNNEIRLLYYKRDELLRPNVLESVSVPLFEQYWQREDGQQANREHFLMALAGLNAILIKATYTTTTQEVGLQSVSLEIAEERNTGLRRAYEVEECRCPVGYRGLSCQECDAGYYRIDHGLYLGLCEPCNCHGHSRDCDVDSGACLNCGNHTTGEDCGLCEPGYTGNPQVGEICTPIDQGCRCDPRGSLQAQCVGGRCTCKVNVIGAYCDACRAGTFDLQESHRTGCLECWCSGVTNQCQSSNLFVTQIPMPIVDNYHGFTLTEANRRRVINTGFRLNLALSQIGYDYTIERGQRLYWSLPSQFTGNRITSYGGNLTWTQGYSAPQNAIPDYSTDLVIYGDGISIFWANNVGITPNTNVTTSVKLEEFGFTRVTQAGTQRASRADILRVLSSVEAILIRASYASQTSYVFISDVSLDTAIPQQFSSVRATQIETCRCPPGYKGYSCESCSQGYYRDDFNGRGRECRKCPCNGNEEGCSQGPNGQVTCKCLPGFSGPYCEGYQVDSTPQTVISSTSAPQPSPPTIIVTIREPTLQIIARGSTIRYNCGAQSVYQRPVTIRWSKEQGSLPLARAVDDGNGYLVILDAIASDSGTYVCTAYDGQSYATQKVNVVVGEIAAPKVTLEPNGALQLTAGQYLSVNCEATGIPPPTVEWGRYDRSPVNRKSALRSSVFTIASVKKSDEGTYYCRASNNAGYDEQRITIYVSDNTQRPPEPSPGDVRVIIQPTEFFGASGETVRLECTASQSEYTRVKWSRYPNESLPSSSIERNGLLLIYNASPQDSGIYVCSVISDRNGATLTQSNVPVTIGGSRRPPVLIVEPERQDVAQGSTAVIRCVSSDPTSRVTWSKVNDGLPDYAQSVGNELRIPLVQVKDRGVYVCQSTTDNGDISEVSAILEVQRREPPSVEIYPKERQIILEGGSALIQCRVTGGEPSPTLRWSRPDNRSLSSRVQEIEGVLRFIDASEADEGQYICTAENLAGKVTAVAILEITSQPIIVINPRGPVTVSVGRPVQLECSARGKPTPSVRWINPNRPEEYPSAPPSRPETYAVYRITRAQLTDAGIYTCVAINSAGRNEERVQLTVIEDGENSPSGSDNSILSSVAPVEMVIFPIGTNANLRCNVGPIPESVTIQWSRLEGDLPPYHQVRSGELILFSVDRTYAGNYTCLGLGSSNEPLFSQTIELRVVGPPQITLNPIRQVVRPGDNPYVICAAQGDQPISIEWSTGNFTDLPRSVTVDKGLLQFRGITVYDAGRYLCTARNMGGEAQAIAEVLVSEVTRPSRPIVAPDHEQHTFEGNDLDLRCTVNQPRGQYRITWRRERAQLPQNHRIEDGTLHLYNLRAEDSDRYICELTTATGTSSDYIDVQVEHIGNVSLSIEASKDNVKVGETVILLCNANGEIDGNVIWSKVDGRFENNVNVENNLLKIVDIKLANAGAYRCSAYTNRQALKYVDYAISLALPSGAASSVAVETKTAKYGESIVFPCSTNLDPPANYSWIVHSYEKSLRRIVNSKTLTIPNLSVNESGLYICSVSNPDTTVTIPTVLVVTDVIPSFSKNSYLTLQPLVQASHYFQIEITFRPKSGDGLILYNGQKRDGTGDYVSFGLNYGIPEFRFDVGSGSAVIRGYTPLALDTWHTVRLIRSKKDGVMEIDRQDNVTGHSPGSFESLDLQLPLYVGGLPYGADGYNQSGFRTGFEGCVNRLLINNRNVDLKKEAKEAYGIGDCTGCENNPCLYGGVCQQTPTVSGYTCFCLPGYSGENCRLATEICYPDTCGEGACIENEDGVECLCPVGRTGERCNKHVEIESPAFTRNSYVAYATPLLKRKFKVFMTIKPAGNSYADDGLLLYIAASDTGVDDYISLSIVNSFAELRFRVYSRDVVLRSRKYLVHNEPVNINVTMDSSQVLFTVGNDQTQAEVFNAIDQLPDLKLFTPLYVGGYDKRKIILPQDLPVKTGFHGCISMLEVSGLQLSVWHSRIDAANINDCYATFGDICRSKKPCQNEGICTTTRDTYNCECVFGFSGRNCERKQDLCEYLRPCQNRGQCISARSTYKCLCELGFTGKSCEIPSMIDSNVNLKGDGYVELSGTLLPFSDFDKTIKIEFTTTASNGLLFWHGQNVSSNGREQDFISIAVENGYVVLNFRAEQYFKSLRATDHRVNDGKLHTVSVKRENQIMALELDSKTTDYVSIEEAFNTPGSIFIGGLPDIRQTTGNLYSEGFIGCILSMKVKDYNHVNFRYDAIGGRNAAPCSDQFEDTNTIN